MFWAQRRRSRLAGGATAFLLVVCGCAGTSGGQQPERAQPSAPVTAPPSQSGPPAIGAPVNLGTPVNGPGFDGGPDPSADNDLWVATRTSPTNVFGTPVNLGPPVNTSGFEDRPAIGSDGVTLYFMSDRPGGIGNIDIWQVSISSRPT